ncbi:hypothetical protein [Nostoc linckia]|uniref:hypothetical protein n=1 Tax=Nostoc linckia TaxID=92942 RepID=UPI0015D504E2|nr:hypothetical protein [Nostoc linckia]
MKRTVGTRAKNWVWVTSKPLLLNLRLLTCADFAITLWRSHSRFYNRRSHRKIKKPLGFISYPAYERLNSQP